MKSCRFLSGIVYLALCSAAFGQATTASLTGVVEDPTKAVVPKVSVTAINTDTGAKTRTFTNKQGIYVFPSLQTGNYRIEVDKQGFKGIIEAGLTLHVQDVLQLNFHMAVGSMSESVTVNAGELSMNAGTVSTVIDKTLIENMPLNGKDLTTLFELSPGTQLNAGGSPENGGGFSVDGQRPTANYLTIDGTSGNAYIPAGNGGSSQTGAGIAISASGGTNGILPIDAIEEYRMDTSTYTAENGRTPGGQIQVRTRSGTNRFHGTLFENFRNQVLDATDWFVKYNEIKQSPLRMNDFGGTLGGPIIKNMLFFFVANDNLVLDQPNTSSVQDVPGQALISQAYSAYKAFLAVFPAGNTASTPGSCLGSDPYCDPSNPGFDFFSASYPYQIRDHTTSIRVDGQLPRTIHAFFRANIAPSTSYLPGIVGNGTQVNIHTYTGGLTIPLGRRIVDDLTVNHTSTATKFLDFDSSVGGNNPNAIEDNVPTGVDASKDVFGFELNSANYGAYPYAEVGPQDLNNLAQWNIVESLSGQFGRHSLRLGADVLQRTSSLVLSRSNFLVQVNLEPATPYTDLDTGIITSLGYSHTIGNPNIHLANTSLFVNDDWQVNSSLALNVGLRWEYNPPPSVGPIGTLALQGTSIDPTTIQAAVTTNPLYVTRYDNFAPRVGFAWSALKSENIGTVVRGGFGIYFDTGQAATASAMGGGEYPYTYTQNYNNLQYSSINWAGLYQSATLLGSLPLYNVSLIDPNLQSPRTYEWSLTLDQALGKYTKMSASYVGNDGELLVGDERYYNYQNSLGQYPVNTSLVSKNGSLNILRNQAHSNYQALQMQLTSRIGELLNGRLSYTWSHAEDNGSTDFSSVGEAAPSPITNSANDIRHMFAAAIHYAPKSISDHRIIRAMTDGWGIDTIARLQTAAPLTVFASVNQSNLNTFLGNADVVQGVPAVLHEHLDSFGRVVPGNKLLNWAAFASPPEDSSGNLLRQGNSPTNGYRLFGLTQWDLAASRSWRIWRQLDLNFRVDAFNILNTANFADPSYNSWSSSNKSTFGISSSTYASANGSTPSQLGQSGAQLSVFQNGGPRELQLSMKLKF